MSTAANAAQPHTALQVYVQGAQVAVQPKTVGQPGQVETLSIDLSSGSVQVLTSSAQQGAAKEVLGILGLCKLQTGGLSVTCLLVGSWAGTMQVQHSHSCHVMAHAWA